jgi:hypothetical protein
MKEANSLQLMSNPRAIEQEMNYSKVKWLSYSSNAASALLVQVPAKQLPDGHVVPSSLLVAPAHTPVMRLHVPGLRQLPACAVQLTLFAAHRSADCGTKTSRQV